MHECGSCVFARKHREKWYGIWRKIFGTRKLRQRSGTVFLELLRYTWVDKALLRIVNCPQLYDMFYLAIYIIKSCVLYRNFYNHPFRMYLLTYIELAQWKIVGALKTYGEGIICFSVLIGIITFQQCTLVILNFARNVWTILVFSGHCFMSMAEIYFPTWRQLSLFHSFAVHYSQEVLDLRWREKFHKGGTSWKIPFIIQILFADIWYSEFNE